MCAMIPGSQNSKSIFNDDLQVSHISENQVGHGVRVKGITDPTTYPVVAGDIGEKIDGTLGNVALSSTVAANFGTIALTAGIWMVYSHVFFAPGSSPTITYASSGVTATSATLPAKYSNYTGPTGTILDVPVTVGIPTYVSIATPTTYYLVVKASFTPGSLTATAANSTFYAVRQA